MVLLGVGSVVGAVEGGGGDVVVAGLVVEVAGVGRAVTEITQAKRRSRPPVVTEARTVQRRATLAALGRTIPTCTNLPAHAKLPA